MLSVHAVRSLYTQFDNEADAFNSIASNRLPRSIRQETRAKNRKVRAANQVFDWEWQWFFMDHQIKHTKREIIQFSCSIFHFSNSQRLSFEGRPQLTEIMRWMEASSTRTFRIPSTGNVCSLHVFRSAWTARSQAYRANLCTVCMCVDSMGNDEVVNENGEQKTSEIKHEVNVPFRQQTLSGCSSRKCLTLGRPSLACKLQQSKTVASRAAVRSTTKRESKKRERNDEGEKFTWKVENSRYRCLFCF